ERRQDIPLLVDHFIAKFNERLKKQVSGIEPEGIERLVSYHWPGNIRELENVIERTMLFGDGPTIRALDLPGELMGVSPVVAEEQPPPTTRVSGSFSLPALAA